MKKLAVPFFKQDTGYTCGPTSLQMIFAFYGKRFSEAALADVLHTAPDFGTRRQRMREVVTEYGLYCYVNDRADFAEFELFMHEEIPVVVRFLETDNNEDHYGVVIGANETHIVIHDPWNGPEIRFTRDEFMPRWTCEIDGDCDQWLMAVSPNPIPHGRQYIPS